MVSLLSKVGKFRRFVYKLLKNQIRQQFVLQKFSQRVERVLRKQQKMKVLNQMNTSNWGSNENLNFAQDHWSSNNNVRYYRFFKNCQPYTLQKFKVRTYKSSKKCQHFWPSNIRRKFCYTVVNIAWSIFFLGFTA